MLGAIIGDIVGSVYEFDPIKTKEFEFFADHRGEKCAFTDDTVMTLAVARALMDSAPDGHDLADKAFHSMHEIGRHYPDCGYGERFGMWLFMEEPAPYGSYGNGAAMRVSPVAHAARSLEEALTMSDMVTGLTHNHPEGLKGARAAAACTWLALHGRGKREIREYAESAFYRLPASLDEIRPGYRFKISCQETVPQAIQAFLESTDFEDAIRNAISLGGDSDTLAAITGGIAGAYYGVPEALGRRAAGYLSEELAAILEGFEEWLAQKAGK